jgi:hypothetical protein
MVVVVADASVAKLVPEEEDVSRAIVEPDIVVA